MRKSLESDADFVDGDNQHLCVNVDGEYITDASLNQRIRKLTQNWLSPEKINQADLLSSTLASKLRVQYSIQIGSDTRWEDFLKKRKIASSSCSLITGRPIHPSFRSAHVQHERFICSYNSIQPTGRAATKASAWAAMKASASSREQGR